MAIKKCEINVPLSVTHLKYCDYAEGKYGPQLKLKDTAGDLVFVPLDIVNALLAAGAVTETGVDEQKHPTYKVNGAPALTLTRRDKAPYDVAINGTQVTGLGTPVSQEARKAIAKAEAPAPADPRNQWGELAKEYKQAVALARQTWGDDYEPVALVAAAATLFIEANKRGLKPVPNPKEQAEAIRKTFDEVPKVLQEEEPCPF